MMYLFWTLREYVSRQRKSEWNFLVGQLSTQFYIVIQRYLRKLPTILRLNTSTWTAMSLSILSSLQWVWLQFCLIGVTCVISSDSTYPNPCFAFRICTKLPYLFCPRHMSNDVVGHSACSSQITVTAGMVSCMLLQSQFPPNPTPT